MVARRSGPPAHSGKIALPRGRKWYWRVIRDLDRAGPWTIADIRARSNAETETIRAFVKRLELGGLARRVTNPCGLNAHAYRLTSSPSAVPVIRDDGSAAPPSAQAHVWTAIRRLREFTTAELAIAASTDEVAITASTTKSYLSRLARAGYLVNVRGARRLSVWRLKPGMNTGPEPPRILTSGAVFDANRNEIITAEGSSCPSA